MPGGHFRAERPTLIEIVDDVTGAGQAPVKGGVNRKGADEALKRTALRKAPSPASLTPSSGRCLPAAGDYCNPYSGGSGSATILSE